MLLILYSTSARFELGMFPLKEFALSRLCASTRRREALHQIFKVLYPGFYTGDILLRVHMC